MGEIICALFSIFLSFNVRIFFAGYVKNRRKAGTIIAEEKSGSLSAWKQGGIIPDKDISGSGESMSKSSLGFF
jgi:hypothetical protein